MQSNSTISQTLPQTKERHSVLQVRIAYFIMVHQRPEAFKTLLEKIYTRDQLYLIHIDRKASAETTEVIQDYVVQYPNVYILESMNIVSGGFSMIQAELNAMEFLLNASKHWDYLINLSGEDLPLRSQQIIRQFLTVNAGRNYIFYYDQKFYRPDTLQRIQNHFTELTHRISSLIYKRDFMRGVIPYIGGKWFIFTRETCSFLSNNEKVMDFEDYYLHTLLPAESFFQTVLMNTDFNDIIVNDDKRATINPPLIGKDNYYNRFLKFLKESNSLFINKFGDLTDDRIIECVATGYDIPLPEIDEIERELKRDLPGSN
ncbi:beta-1,6-N-acetylglucosaminyltransferase [Chryseobacterium sp. SSA4.19]|uniref:beta-1,6-N-acetylglucosaminyltransferase n=1 Tax=Chryseobacterium sp. SSA4.19 TaxID=2919915 RepID=UPI001F4E4085|nr:beta-1,6-N-acetylglucosaminyltransferase [Chryseobacterium sp. SSA4.19]MCJ8154180.1 beta-1,6-N-acetylglucosaminyltransferase [Chryseobacterium sp. SSA4.19]